MNTKFKNQKVKTEISNNTAPIRQVRAAFSQSTVRVYQAFSVEIAEKAIAQQNLVSPFKLDRMTWIKPSFTWMMYRSSWATNSPVTF